VSALEGVDIADGEALLDALELDNISRGRNGEWQYSCPYEGHAFGDRHPSAHFNENKLVFRCAGCGKAGSVLDLVSNVRSCSKIEALRWLRQEFGDAYKPPLDGSVMKEMDIWEQKRRTVEQPARQRLPVGVDTLGPHGIFALGWEPSSSNSEPAVEYMLGRGFTPATLQEWQIGFDHWTERITLPYFDADGRLVAFKGRTIYAHKQPRYTVLGDDPRRRLRYGIGYGFDLGDPNAHVFGLHRARTRTLVVCEGELNALAVSQAGVPGAVAIGTTTMTPAQRMLLRMHADELVFFYDSDAAGIHAIDGGYDDTGTWKPGLAEYFAPYARVRVVDEHEGDPASLGATYVRQLVKTAKSWLARAVAV
jgi:DNA primase